ncbi:MAG TPA: hypothetical protein VFO69_00380 [Allosphingosinicella sp.]|nr:hypothetical protein [Allosphingosinicella sp.]
MADVREGEGTGPAVAPGPQSVTVEPGPTASRARLSLANIAHGLKIVALLLFLLPWVTVSCAEQNLVSLSGMDLATGSITVTNPMTGENVQPAQSGEPDLPVLIGALLIALTLVAGFVVRHAAAWTVSVAGLTVAAALLIYSVLYRLPGRARESATADSAPGISESQIAELIRIDVAIGFWLTLAALTGAILVTFLARSRAIPGAP